MFYYSELDLTRFMQECIKLAVDNPLNVNRPHVGAVVVNKNHIVGRGKKKYDLTLDLEMHAELVALMDAGIGRTAGAVLVTTLEPCCPIDEFPTRVRSCCQQILENGIEDVVYGILDCLPTVHDSAGVSFLYENGVKVTHLTDLIPSKTLMYKGHGSTRLWYSAVLYD
ncbi:MAG: deaminase [Candidatus Pacearchaeota archaeon]|nr:deaminase [Candidatus Pacearchaeota archaeon]